MKMYGFWIFALLKPTLQLVCHSQTLFTAQGLIACQYKRPAEKNLGTRPAKVCPAPW